MNRHFFKYAIGALALTTAATLSAKSLPTQDLNLDAAISSARGSRKINGTIITILETLSAKDPKEFKRAVEFFNEQSKLGVNVANTPDNVIFAIQRALPGGKATQTTKENILKPLLTYVNNTAPAGVVKEVHTKVEHYLSQKLPKYYKKNNKATSNKYKAARNKQAALAQ